MNRRPSEPSEGRLDAEERALAALLPRLHGRSEPGAELDARILASAHAATRAAGGGARPLRRHSWIAPAALAASLVLAVGLAWQLRPPPRLPAPAAGAQADADGSDAMAVRPIPAPAPADGPPASQPEPMMVPPPVAPAAPTRVAGQAGRSGQEPSVAAASPPPPPPPPPAPVALETPGAVDAVAAPQAVRAAQAGMASRDRQADSNAAAQAQNVAQRASAEATIADPVADPEEPGEDVPPATAESPEVRAAWLRRIGELLKQGKAEEAKASLDEFRRRYPDAALPPELRALQD